MMGLMRKRTAERMIELEVSARVKAAREGMAREFAKDRARLRQLIKDAKWAWARDDRNPYEHRGWVARAGVSGCLIASGDPGAAKFIAAEIGILVEEAILAVMPEDRIRSSGCGPVGARLAEEARTDWPGFGRGSY